MNSYEKNKKSIFDESGTPHSISKVSDECETARAEKSLLFTLNNIKIEQEEKSNSTADTGRFALTLVNSCISLMQLYIRLIRTACAEKNLNNESLNSMHWRLLELTIQTGETIEELCTLSEIECDSSEVKSVTLQMFSDILQPPSLQGCETSKESMQFFWRCYPWWCCLLYHSPSSNLAARAFNWVSHYYSLREIEMSGTKSSYTMNIVAFISALFPMKRVNRKELLLLLTPLDEGETQLSTAREEKLAESIYPISLGQSVDVYGANLVQSFIRGHIQRGNSSDGVRDNSININDDEYNDDNDENNPRVNTSLLSSIISQRRVLKEKEKLEEKQDKGNEIPLQDSFTLKRPLFVAAKLGTLFATQDIHTLLALRAEINASKRQANKKNSILNTMEEEEIENKEEKEKENKFHCEVCSIMKEYFSEFNGVCKRSPIAYSIMILNIILLRTPLCVSVPVKRCIGEMSAAAAIVAILQRDKRVANNLFSVLIHTNENSASLWFLTLWRAALSSSINNFSELMPWLFSGLAQYIVIYTGEIRNNLHTLIGNIDSTFKCMIETMVAYISSTNTTSLLLHSNEDNFYLHEMPVCGFLEVWDVILRTTPQFIGPILQKYFINLIIGSDLEHDNKTSGILITLKLHKFLNKYYNSVVKRRICKEEWKENQNKRNDKHKFSTLPHSVVWWPDITLDTHKNCLKVLQHILLISEYLNSSEITTYIKQFTGNISNSSFTFEEKVQNKRKHPAAFFLEGHESLCMRLLSTPSDSSFGKENEEIQIIAADIIAATVKILFTKFGHSLFISPFGKSSNHYAGTYTRLLYLRFLEKFHQTQISDYSYIRSILRALRFLTLGEIGAHRSAISLSIPIMISHMLLKSNTILDLDDTITHKSFSIKKEENKAATITIATPISTSSLVDELGNTCDSNLSNNTEQESNIVNNINIKSNSPSRPFISALPLGNLAPPQYYTSNGDTSVGNIIEPQPHSPPVNVSSKIKVPPLQILKKKSLDNISVNNNNNSLKEYHLPDNLKDSKTLAELLFLLCCLLPGHKSGMISQSSLLAAHYLARIKSKRTQLDIARANSPFVRVLKAMEEFTHNPLNKISVDLFDKIVTLEIQAVNSLSIGVIVISQLLIPNPNLVEGLNIIKRIGAGGYGAVFAATCSCNTNINFFSSKYKLNIKESYNIALKILPITRPDTEDCNTLISSHTEATALKILQGHSNICEIILCGCTNSHYVIGMPLYSGGSLREWRISKSGFPIGLDVENFYFSIRKDKNMSSSLTSSSFKGNILSVCGPIFAQVLEAVEFMHTNNIRHNDIKADNILIETFQIETVTFSKILDESEISQQEFKLLGDKEIMIPTTVRLCDFGVCDVIVENTGILHHDDIRWGPTKGTEAVQAPEALALTNNNNNNIVEDSSVTRELAADMWSCGCLLYELLTGVMLFSGTSIGRLLSIAANSQNDTFVNCEVLQPDQRKVLDIIGCGVTNFILQLLTVDPMKRPSASMAREAWEIVMQDANISVMR